MSQALAALPSKTGTAAPSPLVRACNYWLRDPAAGLANTAAVAAMRAAGVDACSDLGAHSGLWFGRMTGRFHFPSWDAQARRNWVRLRPDKASAEDVDAGVRKMWLNITRTLAEFAVVDRFWAEGRITVERRDCLEDATASGRPVILMPVHLGNWEALGPTLVGLGHRVNAVYQPPDNRFDHRLALRARQRFGVSMLPPGPAGVRPALRILAAGHEIVSMFRDEFFRERVHGPFFGRPPVASGNLGKIARLAQMSGALVLPAYALRHGGARFTVHFCDPVDLAAGEMGRATTAVRAARLNAVIEPIVRAHLAQWFWLPNLDLQA